VTGAGGTPDPGDPPARIAGPLLGEVAPADRWLCQRRLNFGSGTRFVSRVRRWVGLGAGVEIIPVLLPRLIGLRLEAVVVRGQSGSGLRRRRGQRGPRAWPVGPGRAPCMVAMCGGWPTSGWAAVRCCWRRRSAGSAASTVDAGSGGRVASALVV
jgi:hypothetical protein